MLSARFFISVNKITTMKFVAIQTSREQRTFIGSVERRQKPRCNQTLLRRLPSCKFCLPGMGVAAAGQSLSSQRRFHDNAWKPRHHATHVVDKYNARAS